MPWPRMLTDEVQATICTHLKLGSWLEIACQAAGVSRESLRLWLKKGHAVKRATARGEPVPSADLVYAAFVDAVDRATAESELADLRRIELASRTVWQAAAWRLERRHQDRWGNSAAILKQQERQIAQLEKEVAALREAASAPRRARVAS